MNLEMSNRHLYKLMMPYLKPLWRRSAGTSLRMNLEMSNRHLYKLMMPYLKPLWRRSSATSLHSFSHKMSITYKGFKLRTNAVKWSDIEG
jgi:hypothetical protein